MNELEYLNKILTTEERAKIQSFYENEFVRNAVKKALLVQLYHEGVVDKENKEVNVKNWIFAHFGNNNEILGATIRAVGEGIIALENGFNRLANIKQEKKVTLEEVINEAR